MIRLSVPFRQALSRLTLPVMLMLSLGIVLFGRADQNLGDHLRAGLDDLLAPAYQVVAGPIEALESGTGAIGNLFNLAGQNAQLRAENARLLQWQAVAMALQAQNDAMKASLNYIPRPAPDFFTAPVVADLGGGIRIFTVENGAAASDLTIDAVLTDGGVTKEGTGTLTLSAANNYTGATTIAQGRLQLGTANAINSASALNLIGGTLDLNGFTPTSFTQTLTIAGLGASIDFGFGHLTGVTLQFADSSAVSWTSDLNLLDFSPGTDLLNFGSATGLTDAQLTDILLPDFTATGLDRSGNVLFTADTPATAPEPSVLALLIPVLALLVVVGLWRRRAATTS